MPATASGSIASATSIPTTPHVTNASLSPPSPARSLDFAEVARPCELERAVEEAERRGLFALRKVEELCVLAEQFEPARTRSELERDFLDLCRAAGLPAPEVNVEVAGYEVDCVWHAQRLVVELDTRSHVP